MRVFRGCVLSEGGIFYVKVLETAFFPPLISRRLEGLIIG